MNAKFALRKYQRRWCRAIVDTFKAGPEGTPMKRLLGEAATGAGKCWATGTPMLLADGTRIPVEQLKPGDILLGPDSQPRRITATNAGRAALYRLTPHRHAEPMIVNGEHILSLQCTNIGNRRLTLPTGKKCGTDDTVFLTVEELLAASKTARHCLKWWQTGFQLQPRQCDSLPCPPWLLGFWLADGSSYHATIYKPRATELCREDAEKMGWKVKRTKLPDGKCECASITGGFRTTLISMDLLQNKHIPAAYLRADTVFRKTLLAGILDGDGFSDKEGFELTLKKGRLADDAAFLARSLGFSVTVVDKIVNGKTYRRANLSGGPDIPTKRHPQRNRKQKKDPLRTGFTIESIGAGDYHGFTIDGPDRQLLMPDGTVAHNTIMGSAMIFERQARKPPERCLFLADSDELCDQALKKIHSSIGIIPDLEKASEFASLDAQVVVASIQSLSIGRRLGRFPADHFGLVIADEAHLSMADSWQRVLKHFASADILGITATPERGDKRSLLKFYEHVAAKIGLGELIDAQHLSPIVVQTAPIHIPVTAKITGDDSDAVAQDIRPYFSEVLKAIDKYAGDRQRILVFHPSIKASQEFTAMAQDHGIVAEHVDGASPDRQAIIEGYSTGRYRMLSNAQLLTKGFDCPEIDCIIILRPTKSRGAYIQMVGRGTRIHCPHGCTEWCDHPDRKANLLVLDFLWEFKTHDVMGPADLVTDAPEQKKQVKAAMDTDEPFDVFDLDREITDEREQRLIKAMQEAANRRARRFDARQVAAILHQPDLLDYEPMEAWEVKPVSQRQAEMLEKIDILNLETVTSRGMASKLITCIIQRRHQGFCTPKQLVTLGKFGIDASAMTSEEASAAIGAALGKLPPRP